MSFLRTFLAALAAFVVANVLAVVVMVVIVGGVVAGVMGGIGEAKSLRGSVLKIDLAGGVNDAPSNVLFTRDMELDESKSLWDVLRAIEYAATDSHIETIYLDIEGGVSLAGAEEIRAALERLKEQSGKRIIAWSNYYTQSEYYLASVADEVYVHPEGGVMWTGLAAQVMFYKGLLDKLGVGVEVLRHGEFKSAVEPFVMEKMSAESRLQMEALTGDIWAMMREQVGRSRGIEPLKLSDYARELSVESAEDAVRLGLVDAVKYEDEMPSEDDIVSLGDYIAALHPARGHRDEIALVYLDGDIMDGDRSVCEKLAEMREDDDVKGVVVRVNSPGGSALASDEIWREMTLLKEDKPVVVSMGGVAASGGYYAACPADMILCDKATITGSIGVFGLMPEIGGALEDKLGVTTDVVLSEPHADIGSVMRPLDTVERDYIMRGIERIYRTFVGHVAAGRNMTFDKVDSLGGGRVWSGDDAVENGLADGIGGLTDAIQICAERAGVAHSFRVVEAVDPPDMLSMLVRTLSGVRSVVSGHSIFGTQLPLPEVPQGIQARMPFELKIKS